MIGVCEWIEEKDHFRCVYCGIKRQQEVRRNCERVQVKDGTECTHIIKSTKNVVPGASQCCGASTYLWLCELHGLVAPLIKPATDDTWCRECDDWRRE